MWLSLALILITAIWGWTFVVVKEATEEYGVLPFLVVRFAIATLAIAPLARRGWSRQATLVGGGIGVVLAAGYLFQTFGLAISTPTNTGLITGLFVVFAPLCNRLLFGVQAHRMFWVAMALSLVGLYLLTAEAEGTAGPAIATGDLLTLAASACLGLHIALLDRFAKGYDPAVLAAGQLGATTVVVLVGLVAAGTYAAVGGPGGFVVQPLSWPSRDVWMALLITGLLASAGGFYVQTLAQRSLPAVRIAVILTLEPVFAALFGWLAGDRLSGVQIGGGVLMVAALILAEIYPHLRRALAAR
jgi:drug/metabolite transporter (DMT)-like permease